MREPVELIREAMSAGQQQTHAILLKPALVANLKYVQRMTFGDALQVNELKLR